MKPESNVGCASSAAEVYISYTAPNDRQSSATARGMSLRVKSHASLSCLTDMLLHHSINKPKNVGASLKRKGNTSMAEPVGSAKTVTIPAPPAVSTVHTPP